MAHLEEQWVGAELPVLQYTRDRILGLAEDPDKVDLNKLASIIASDPLMTLRVLRLASAQCKGRMQGAPKTALEAVILIGTGPLFRSCQDLPVIQDVLAGRPEALAGLTLAMTRSYRAARIAHRFASLLDDPDAEVIHEVALLHDFAELLLWLHRPVLAQATWQERTAEDVARSRHRAHHALPADMIQLGVRLMKAWHFNSQLIRLIEAHAAPTSRGHLVDLAVRLVDRSAEQSEAIDDVDIQDASVVLRLDVDATRQLLRGL